MEEKPKPCPFCGGLAEIEYDGIYRWARCTKCKAETYNDYTDKEVAKKWNSRPIEDHLQARIEELEEILDDKEEQAIAIAIRVTKLESELAALKESLRWRLIEDELPEDSGIVFVLTTHRAIYAARYIDGLWYRDGTKVNLDDVEYWHPPILSCSCWR